MPIWAGESSHGARSGQRREIRNADSVGAMSDVLPLSPDELLTTTRSVRRRLDLERPVPVAVVREALEVALQAPTGGNAQTWHWILVTDPEKRQAIARLYARSFARYRSSGARTYDGIECPAPGSSRSQR